MGVIARALTGYTRGPAHNWTIPATPSPPIRISTTGMHGQFKTGCPGLSHLVSSHEEPLTSACSSLMEFLLLRVRPVVSEPVLTDASALFLLELRQ